MAEQGTTATSGEGSLLQQHLRGSYPPSFGQQPNSAQFPHLPMNPQIYQQQAQVPPHHLPNYSFSQPQATSDPSQQQQLLLQQQMHQQQTSQQMQHSQPPMQPWMFKQENSGNSGQYSHPNIENGSGSASGMSSSQQHGGPLSPTRSGSISSHGTLMSPPPTNSRPPAAKSPGAQSSQLKPPKAPEKPLIPYLRFSKSVWETVKKEYPTAPFAEIGRIIGEKWRNCPADAKQKFTDDYLRDKELYAQAQKAYMESPEYLEYQNAKARREQEEEERKRRESSVASGAAAHRGSISHHSSATVSGASAVEAGQPSLQGPLEEMQSMSQRIIPTKVPNPALRDAPEPSEEELDDCLRAKHIASARYRRNQRLLAEVFSDAIVPDGRMIVNEQRMTLLRKQVASLEHHQERLLVEQKELVEKHDAKKQKLTEDSETFAKKLQKVKEDCKPVGKEQYQSLVDKYTQILEKQWADFQAQNAAKTQTLSAEAMDTTPTPETTSFSQTLPVAAVEVMDTTPAPEPTSFSQTPSVPAVEAMDTAPALEISFSHPEQPHDEPQQNIEPQTQESQPHSEEHRPMTEEVPPEVNPEDEPATTQDDLMNGASSEQPQTFSEQDSNPLSAQENTDTGDITLPEAPVSMDKENTDQASAVDSGDGHSVENPTDHQAVAEQTDIAPTEDAEEVTKVEEMMSMADSDAVPESAETISPLPESSAENPVAEPDVQDVPAEQNAQDVPAEYGAQDGSTVQAEAGLESGDGADGELSEAEEEKTTAEFTGLSETLAEPTLVTQESEPPAELNDIPETPAVQEPDAQENETVAGEVESDQPKEEHVSLPEEVATRDVKEVGEQPTLPVDAESPGSSYADFAL